MPSDTPAPAALDTAVRLLIGSADADGTASALADALGTLPNVSATVFREPPAPDDTPAPAADQQARRDALALLTNYSHVLVESWSPIFGVFGLDARAESRMARRHGVAYGALCTGAELRMPDEHWDVEQWSPYRHLGRGDLGRLRRQVRRLRPLIGDQEWVFVNTPDLIDQVTQARWVPWTVPAPVVVSERPALTGAPRVLHLTADRILSGANQVQEQLTELDAAGRISYRPVATIDELRAGLAEADIVLDEFALGRYGPAACHAMAAGRPVLGHVNDVTRARVRQVAGRDVPIIETTPASLTEVMEHLIADPDRLATAGAAGPAYAAAVHDGRMAARTMLDFLLTEGAP